MQLVCSYNDFVGMTSSRTSALVLGASLGGAGDHVRA